MIPFASLPSLSNGLRLWLALAVTALSCGTGPSALRIVEELGAHEASIAARAAPGVALARDEDGHVVSRSSALAARLPDRANGVIDLATRGGTRSQVRVVLDGASDAAATVVAGRVVYAGAFPQTDRVVLSDASSLEDLLVMHDARAPRSFAWSLHGGGDAELDVEAQDHGWAVFDAGRRHILDVSTPRAWDGAFHQVALTSTWDARAHVLRVALAEEPRAWPVVVDPTFETSTWFDTARRTPDPRITPGMAFDPARGQMVMFGGVSANLLLFNETWTWNGTYWSDRTNAAVAPPRRLQSVLAFDTLRGETVLFGGGDPLGMLNDTWVWNGTSWTKRVPATSPSPRASCAMTYDTARGEIVLFGGSASTGFQNDTWVWNGVTWTQRFPTIAPPVRVGHMLAFDATRGEVVLFGGGGAGALYLNDTWTWNGAHWTQRSPATSPAVRHDAGMAFDSARQRTVLFGGGGVAGALNDTWTWDGTNWTQQSPLTSPAARLSHALAFDPVRNEIVLFSGTAGSANFLGDTWVWNGTTWAQRAVVLPPPPRSAHAMVYDRARSQVVLFGGTTPSMFDGTNETWTWNGAAWSQRAPATSPPVRFGHALTFDSARGEVLLYGGYNRTSNLLGDTWVWNGTTWIARTPALAPSSRFYHRLAFDAVRRQALLFGGYDSLGANGETWTWDGGTWSRRAPAHAPPARFQHGLAFDAARGNVVLFGGSDSLSMGIPSRYDDTWTWDGADWLEHTLAARPIPRAEMAFAYDTTRAQVLSFGGQNNNGAPNSSLDDTWAWDGSIWMQRAPTRKPIARSAHAMAYDEAHTQMVLFGGRRDDASLANDTWLHTTLGGSCAIDDDCAGAFCTDGVCCAAKTCGTCQTCAGTSPGRCAPVTNREDPDTCAAASGKSCSDLGECKMALGAHAATGLDCASGNLVDGVCCLTPTCAACQTCDATKNTRALHVGECDFAAAGTDPHEECADDGAATCQRDGTCDGAGACRLYAASTACGDNVCLATRATGKFCSGAGACSADPVGRECDAYACRGGACLTACAAEGDCSALHHCAAGQCVADRGAACDGPTTLVSATAERIDCGLYRCEGAACLTQCVSREQCSADAECTRDGRCVAFQPVQDFGSGTGGCTVARSRPTSRPRAIDPALIAVAAWLWGKRRRNRA